MEKRKIHLEDLFTMDNEKKGVWFEPKIEGRGIGIEFLVKGATTDEALADNEHYEKLYAEAREMKDSIERQKQLMEVDAERCAKLVAGIRATSDCEVDFEGKPLEYSQDFIKKLFYKSPLIKTAIVNFASKTANFINRKKNN